MQKYQIFVIILLVFSTCNTAYAQTYNCPTGCIVTVTPQQTITQTPSTNTLGSSSPTVGGFNLGDGISGVLQQIENFFTGTEGTAIPQNNYVNTTGIQKATGSGFNIINDLFKAGFDTGQFMTDLINSFKPFHPSFWIVAIISMLITIFVIIKVGEDVLKRIFIVLGILAIILAILWLIATWLNW